MKVTVSIMALLACLNLSSVQAADLDYEVVKSLPHDASIFTQGAVISGDVLYESGGRYNQSALYKYELDGMTLTKRFDIANRFFAEGMTLIEDKLYLLTWKSQRVFVLDSESLKPKSMHKYQGEGWGITVDDQSQLIKSNGSHVLKYHQSSDFSVTKELEVTFDGNPIAMLNELEFVEGLILANVWQSEDIALICPKNGEVVNWLNLNSIAKKHRNQGVLNGIAWWQNQKQLWVSGKNWNQSYLLSVDFTSSQKKCAES